MSPEKRKKKKQQKKIFRKWHRRIGFSASLFLFNLAITGILLNHYEGLELHKKYIQNNILLDWYGVKAPNDINCAKISNLKNELSHVCQIDSSTYLIKPDNQLKILTAENELIISLVQNEHQIFLLTDKNLYFYNNKNKILKY